MTESCDVMSFIHLKKVLKGKRFSTNLLYLHKLWSKST